MADSTPAIEGWFTTGESPALIASKCTLCAKTFFPPTSGFCGRTECDGESFETTELSRTGTVWSYTDAQYKPPAPYIPNTEPFEPFALAAVELEEGITVLGQVADGFGVADLQVGSKVELVVETLYSDDTGDRTIWRWKPVTETNEGETK